MKFTKAVLWLRVAWVLREEEGVAMAVAGSCSSVSPVGLPQSPGMEMAPMRG